MHLNRQKLVWGQDHDQRNFEKIFDGQKSEQTRFDKKIFVASSRIKYGSNTNVMNQSCLYKYYS